MYSSTIGAGVMLVYILIVNHALIWNNTVSDVLLEQQGRVRPDFNTYQRCGQPNDFFGEEAAAASTEVVRGILWVIHGICVTIARIASLPYDLSTLFRSYCSSSLLAFGAFMYS
jgi:hypothetical protein